MSAQCEVQLCKSSPWLLGRLCDLSGLTLHGWIKPITCLSIWHFHRWVWLKLRLELWQEMYMRNHRKKDRWINNLRVVCSVLKSHDTAELWYWLLVHLVQTSAMTFGPEDNCPGCWGSGLSGKRNTGEGRAFFLKRNLSTNMLQGEVLVRKLRWHAPHGSYQILPTISGYCMLLLYTIQSCPHCNLKGSWDGDNKIRTQLILLTDLFSFQCCETSLKSYSTLR